EIRLLYSSRSVDDVIYLDELTRLAPADWLYVVHTLTRSQPNGWPGPSRRIDRAMLAEIGWPASRRPHGFICGPTPLVESVADDCLAPGYEALRIKTERFGPTGA